MTSIAWHIRLKDYHKESSEESTPDPASDPATNSNETGKCVGTLFTESAAKLEPKSCKEVVGCREKTDKKPFQEKHWGKATCGEDTSNVLSAARPLGKDTTYKRHRSFSKGNREDDELLRKIASPSKSIAGKTISKLASPGKVAHGKTISRRSSSVQPQPEKILSESPGEKLCSPLKDAECLVKSRPQQQRSPSKGSSRLSRNEKGSGKRTLEKEKSLGTPQKTVSKESTVLLVVSDDKQNGRPPSGKHDNPKPAKRKADSDRPISGTPRNSDVCPHKLLKTESQGIHFQGNNEEAEEKTRQGEAVSACSSVELRTKGEESSLSLSGGSKTVGKCELSADE